MVSLRDHSPKFRLSLLACVALMLASLHSMAAEPIKVNRSARYLKDGVGTAEMRECDWTTRMIGSLVQEADGRVKIVDGDLSKETGPTLDIRITSAQAYGSDRPGRQNWAHVRGTLKNGEQTLATFEAKTRPTVSKKSNTCKVLEEFSEQLAEYIAKWTKHPKDESIGYKGE